MKIVYMGTPEFAVTPLEYLIKAGAEISLVVTKPDAPKGRGNKMQACPVKLKAEELGLPVSSPEKIKNNEEFFAKLQAAAPDLIVVAAYGKILPKQVLDLPKMGCVNIHGSLLPKYRGAAPIQRAVINGESVTGITLMYMAEGMDTGDMIAKAETEIGEKTSDELFAELSVMGAELLVEYLPKLMDGTAPRQPQNNEEATIAPMLSKEEGHIDFTKSAKEISCLVRGMASYCLWNGETLKIQKTKALEPSRTSAPKGVPGQVVACGKDYIEIACGSGNIRVLKLQAPGKKSMDASAFLLGNKIEIGTVLL